MSKEPITFKISKFGLRRSTFYKPNSMRNEYPPMLSENMEAGMKPRLFHNKMHDVYYPERAYTPIESKEVTIDNAVLYSLEKYKEIFSDFNEDTDIVRLDNYGRHATLFTLDRQSILVKTDSNVVTDLHNGVYKMFFKYGDIQQYCLKKIYSMETDEFINLKNPVRGLGEDVKTFFENKLKYDELKLIPRRGALIYGDPGNGKTYEIIRTIRDLTQNYENCVAIMLDKEIDSFSSLIELRDCLEGKNILFVLEEISERISDGDCEELLNFLDGEYSWKNCYTIATTNYPEKLKKNLIDRPGRFDYIMKVEEPDEEDRRIYLSNFIDNVDENIINLTEGFSVAYLKELVLRSKLKKQDLEVTAKELTGYKKTVSKGLELHRSEIGFNVKNERS